MGDGGLGFAGGDAPLETPRKEMHLAAGSWRDRYRTVKSLSRGANSWGWQRRGRATPLQLKLLHIHKEFP
jgi:hypothetical protein